jgi:hypothetical protein
VYRLAPVAVWQRHRLDCLFGGSLRASARRAKLKVLRGLEAELCFRRYFFVPAAQNLRTRTASAADQRSYCGTFAAAEQRTQNGTNRRSTTDVLSSALIRAEPARC